jgi:hypothetical protein
MSLSLTDELSKFEQDQVTIEYRDRKDNNRKKQMTISADEFIFLADNFFEFAYPASYQHQVMSSPVIKWASMSN